MSDRLEDTSLRLKDEMDLYKRMMDKLRQNRLEFQKEREATQEVGPRPAGTRAPSSIPAPANLLLSLAAHRGLAEGAGAPADVQAGLRAARQGPQCLLWPRRVQCQGPRGGARARGQAAQAGGSSSLCVQWGRVAGPTTWVSCAGSVAGEPRAVAALPVCFSATCLSGLTAPFHSSGKSIQRSLPYVHVRK